MTRILVVDDHPVVAEGWERITRKMPECEILYAPSPLRALQVSRETMPDVLVVDLSFGANKMAGLKLISRVRRIDARLPILVFSMHRSPVIARRALECGANGFINKDAPADDIHAAFVTVRGRGRYIAPDMATRIAFLNGPQPGGDEVDLTPRELEILGLIAEGKAYREISTIACLSYKTITNIGSSLRMKLKAKTLPELVIKAVLYFDK